ncbi:MAG: hypothetical protein HY928_17495 [Elusimicrobia bacterium]|nr:hypothetical protein [Elusimicrobiota bacterium]
MKLLGNRGRKLAAALLTMSLLNEQGLLVSEAWAQLRTAPVKAGAPGTPAVAAPTVLPQSVSLNAPLSAPSLSVAPSLALPTVHTTVPGQAVPAAAAIPLAAAANISAPSALPAALAAPKAAAAAIAAAARAMDSPESAAPATAASRLQVLGRAMRGAAQTAALNQAFDGSTVKVFLTQHGSEPAAVTLPSLRARLAADPAYAKALNASGQVRIVAGGALSEAGAEAVKEALAEAGITAPVAIERIALTAAKQESKAGDMKSAPSNRFLRFLTAPFREAAFLARTFKAAYTKPTQAEFWGGVLSKGPAFVLSAMWWAKLFLPLHPVAFAAALGFSLALQAFHGVWINTWQNFQNLISRQRGLGYQTVFNFIYMQSTSALFRLISYAVIAGTVPPWALAYWRDMGIATVLGTFFGTLGYAGVNGLYDKGRISRRTRSYIQQGRDLFFLLAGTFFASGSMTVFWTLFVIQQSVDISLYILGQRAKARPIAVAVDAAVAETGDFKSVYSMTDAAPRPSALRQALDAVLGIFGIRKKK